jgi:hypothetical protein
MARPAEAADPPCVLDGRTPRQRPGPRRRRQRGRRGRGRWPSRLPRSSPHLPGVPRGDVSQADTIETPRTPGRSVGSLPGQRAQPILPVRSQRDRHEESEDDTGSKHESHPDRHCYHDAVHTSLRTSADGARHRRALRFRPRRDSVASLASRRSTPSWSYHPRHWTEANHWSGMTGLTCSSVTEELNR